MRFVFIFVLLQFIFAQGQVSAQTPAEDLYNRGVISRLSGDTDTAIEYYSKAIELDPKFAYAYYNRGIARYAKSDAAGAIQDYSKAIELRPDLSEAYGNRGNIYSDSGNYAAAMSDFETAIRLKPTNPLTYNSRGFAFQEQGRLDEAIADYNVAIKLDPKFVVALHNRGHARDLKRDFDLAIADYTAALVIDPNYIKSLGNRGIAYHRRGNYNEALADYSRALELRPGNPSDHYNRAITRTAVGDFRGAIDDYTKAISLATNMQPTDPPRRHVYHGRGIAYLKVGDYGKSLADFDEFVGLEPTDARGYLGRSWVKLCMNDGTGAYKDALENLKRLPSKTSDPYAIIVGYLGLMKAGQREEARAFVESWLEHRKDVNWATQVVRYFAGKVAEDALLELAKDKGTKTEAYTYLGEIALIRGDMASARRHFAWVIKNGSKDYSEYNLAVADFQRIEIK
ncbi:MAG: tetratricopeptide repeat protein [Pyrinomonadaceae bacterium]